MTTRASTLRNLVKAAHWLHTPPALLVSGARYVFGSVVLSLALLVRQLPPFVWQEAVGLTIGVLFGMVATRLALSHFPLRGISYRIASRILYTTILLAVVGVQVAASAIGGSEGTRSELAPLIVAPLVGLGLLVGGLMGPAVATLGVSVSAMSLGLAGSVSPELLATSWVVALVGAFSVNPLRQRNDLFRATYFTTAAFGVAAFAFAMSEGMSFQSAGLAAGWAIFGGVGACALFWLAIAIFERAFGVVSDWCLLELCSPDHPLIRDLMINAPGTYAHSVMVGNLAEQAATAIGANGLLCRAMAYYHDIGKAKRPEFFIENARGTNPHDSIQPSLSARIIAAHVRDGLEMADAHRLPPAIRDGIAEHHGTSLITYFYHRMTKDADAHDPILEQQFRYPGPKPRRKETAVLMLADRVEAASRSLSDLSPGRLRAFVWEIVQDVRDDGQLDDSELNFRDLQTIVGSFVSSLRALRHERVEYPSQSLDFDGTTQDISRQRDGASRPDADHSGSADEDA